MGFDFAEADLAVAPQGEDLIAADNGNGVVRGAASPARIRQVEKPNGSGTTSASTRVKL